MTHYKVIAAPIETLLQQPDIELVGLIRGTKDGIIDALVVHGVDSSTGREFFAILDLNDVAAKLAQLKEITHRISTQHPGNISQIAPLLGAGVANHELGGTSERATPPQATNISLDISAINAGLSTIPDSEPREAAHAALRDTVDSLNRTISTNTAPITIASAVLTPSSISITDTDPASINTAVSATLETMNQDSPKDIILKIIALTLQLLDAVNKAQDTDTVKAKTLGNLLTQIENLATTMGDELGTVEVRLPFKREELIRSFVNNLRYELSGGLNVLQDHLNALVLGLGYGDSTYSSIRDIFDGRISSGIKP